MPQRQNTGLKRQQIDKYYTASHIVEMCTSLFKQNVEFSKSDLCIEPSAGNGSFIDTIKSLFSSYYFCDIKPEHPEVLEQDYLTIDPSEFDTLGNARIHILGNPPFGRQSSLAIKFIKKACGFANTISFILPKSFKKDSMKKHFDKNFHLKLEVDLPDDSFIVNGNSHTVPCVFQIWEKRDYERPQPEVLKPTGFKFVKKNENPDISFRRVGVYAGKFCREIENKSPQSHYFIKLLNKEITPEIIEKMNNLNFKNKNDTVAARSISKQELIKELVGIF